MNIPDHLHGICAEVLGIESHTATHKGLWAVILGLTPYRDGNQWCVLYGKDVQEGIAGFGDTPINAMYAFDDAMHRKESYMTHLAGYTKTEHEAAAGMSLEDTFFSHHEQPCDCAVCDDIAFRRSLPAKCFVNNDGTADCDKLRQNLQSKHDANCLLRLILETLPTQLEQRKLTHDRTACAMLIQDSIDYLFRDGEDTLIESPSNDEQQAQKLAYKMGRDSLKREIEDWLTHGFDYENSVMTVHNVREVVQRYCRVI